MQRSCYTQKSVVFFTHVTNFSQCSTTRAVTHVLSCLSRSGTNKGMHVRHCFVHGMEKTEELSMTLVRGECNASDPLTKNVHVSVHGHHAGLIHGSALFKTWEEWGDIKNVSPPDIRPCAILGHRAPGHAAQTLREADNFGDSMPTF